MRRGFFTLISGLSLLLCLGTAGLWLSIRWTPQHNLQRRFAGAIRADGTRSQYIVAVESERFAVHQIRRIFPINAKFGQMQPAIDWYGLQFIFTTGENATLVHPAAGSVQPPNFVYWHITQVATPYWAVIVMTAIAPVIWFRGFRRERADARRDPRCIQCGYDLRATPERCPECGRAVNIPAVAAHA